MSEALQDTLDRLVVLLQECDAVEDGELEEKGALCESLRLLIDIGNVLKLGGSPEGRTSMGLEELSEWHAKLGDTLAWCGLAELLWSANDLDIPCDVDLLGDTIARGYPQRSAPAREFLFSRGRARKRAISSYIAAV